MSDRDRFLGACLAIAIGITAACLLFYGPEIEEAVCCSTF